jgi:endonuclease YncB( thermonuclease family)
MEASSSQRDDGYRRALAVLSIDGRDVAQILIAERHAVVYYGRTDWCKATQPG